MLLISALYGMDPLSIELSRDFWQVATASNHATLSDSVTLSKRRPSARQVGYCVLYFIIKVLFGILSFALSYTSHFHSNAINILTSYFIFN